MKRLGLLAMLALAGCFSVRSDGSDTTTGAATAVGSASGTGTTGRACLNAGMSCARDAECCAGMVCPSGQCQAPGATQSSSGTTGSCEGPDGPCETAADCCAGAPFCVYGFCGTSFPNPTENVSTGTSGGPTSTGTTGGCGSINTPCTDSSQCCAGLLCSLGQCDWQGGTTTGPSTGTSGGCGGGNAPCQSDADCCQGLCVSGTCWAGENIAATGSSGSGATSTTGSGTTGGSGGDGGSFQCCTFVFDGDSGFPSGCSCSVMDPTEACGGCTAPVGQSCCEN